MHYTIYQTATRLYVVRHARDSESGAEEWRVLKVDRTSAELEAAEDPTAYTRPQIQRLLATMHAGNQAHGGLQMVCEAHAIVGSLRFLEGPYLLLVTRRRQLGALCGHKVYGIEATALLPVLSPAAHKQQFGSAVAATAEVRYRKLLAGVQLSKDFFFSYTWPLHQTVQQTFAQAPDAWWAGDPGAPWSSPRVWNAHLAAPLRAALGDASRWVVPLSHGFFEQRPLALLGRTLHLTLIARRSRQFAGTRYLKRGVTESGHCANDVEVEQVVEAGVDWKSGQPLLSSVVQVRGSIPLPWAQRPDSSVYRPEIVLHRFDPLYAATRRHFDQLREQYGEPVCVLDLVKRVERRPRESVLGCEYAAAVRFLNQRVPPDQQRVQYTAFDLSHHAKAARSHLLSDLQRLQEPVLQSTGIFASGGARGGSGGSGPPGSAGAGGAPAAQRTQHGVLRTNCIDSLDRTNVAQFTYGMLALGQQLHALGIAESAWLDPASSMARHLMDLWEHCGHTLALQYGGSEAHATFFQRQRGDWEATTQGRDLLTTVRRFYSNAWTDADKQGAINLFLGTFVPAPGRPHLWDLGGDAYLHTGGGRWPARATSVDERSSFAAATAAAAGVAGSVDLASFPPPLSPEGPRAPPLGRLGSQRAAAAAAAAESEGVEAPALGESLSAASLVSLSSDGSFAPTLSALVDGASSQPPRPLGTASSGEQEEQHAASGAGDGEEPTTPRGSQPGSATGAAVADGAPAAGAAGDVGPLPRPGVRRSPLLKKTARWVEAKLESFDQVLGRQPVAHVRLMAPPPPAKQSPLGGWLSPGKAAQQAQQAAQQGGRPASAGAASGGAGAGRVGVPAPGAAAAAAAAATVEAAGVAEAAPGVPMPANGLRRSNSDPSLASSLGAAALPAAAPPAVAPGMVGRRVTFGEGAPAVLGPRPPAPAVPAAGGAGAGGAPALHRHSAGPGGLRRRSTGSTSVPHSLQRHSTAPASSLEELVDVAAAAAAAGGMGHPFGSSLAGQLLLVEGSPDGQLTWSGSYLLGAGGAGLQRSSSASYHSLAGLNLEGAAAAEASAWQQGSAPAPAAAAAAAAAALSAGAKPQRRIISFPSLARLRSLGRKPSNAAAGAGSSGSDELPPPPPSLLQPSVPVGGGAPEPLSMSAVVFGAEAVRRGVDTLGLPPTAPAWWLTGADPLAAMLEDQRRLRSQIAQQREALATPLDPVEHRALLEQCASLMRPAWALNLASFQHPPQDTQQPGSAPPPTVPPRPPPAQQPVPRQGLAF
ncbi:phosphoinositide phosphatase SAC1 [Micractinium conductrix]|uniref:Phosphoinositide phosphatase SAC1 n=1 Tax=Micractinium conductrix TaxID=554055 RepID=A0A2P6VM57_9CHLO|nr:phosphoinositide phosphatase SAC1 [Micractinium conductrix]|eukprot:PSC75191.1 phosphoinositide phosphatase SAC1 [Micractinium conductrix]